jgi:type I restriction enzyme S subunit
MTSLLQQLDDNKRTPQIIEGLFADGPQYGYTASANSEKVGPRFLRITDIQGNIVEWNSVPYCKISNSEKAKYLLEKDDLVFARTGATTGMSYFINSDLSEEAVFASYLIRLRFNSNVCDPRFLKYFFQSRNYWGQVRGSLSGSAQPGINAVTLSKLVVNLPDLQTQGKIADILDVYDAKIQNNNLIVQKMETIAQSILDNWLMKFHLPGSKQTDYFKSEIGEIPKGWRVGRIKDLVRVESGFPFSSSIFDNLGKYKLVTIRNVQDGLFATDCENHVAILPDKLPRHCILDSGDILLSLTGNVGRICIVSGRDYVLNQRVSVLIPIEERDRAYIYFLFRRKDFQNRLISISKGTAQLNLSPVETRDLEIVVPNGAALEKYSKVATPIYNKIVETNDENQKLKESRDHLLAKLI